MLTSRGSTSSSWISRAAHPPSSSKRQRLYSRLSLRQGWPVEAVPGHRAEGGVGGERRVVELREVLGREPAVDREPAARPDVRAVGRDAVDGAGCVGTAPALAARIARADPVNAVAFDPSGAFGPREHLSFRGRGRRAVQPRREHRQVRARRQPRPSKLAQRQLAGRQNVRDRDA